MFRSGANVGVEIVVDEGKPVVLRRVDVQGFEQVPPELQRELRASVNGELPLGKAFEEEALQRANSALGRRLADHGYAQAVVRKNADVNLPRSSAAVGFWVDAGRPSELGEVRLERLEGLADLPRDRVEHALDLQPGMPYSQAELDESKRALLDLGVFSSVDIEPQLDAAVQGPNGRPRIPILVKLEKAKLRSVHVGGGVSIDALKSDVHLGFGWENQSILGGLRKLEVELTPGAVVYPTRFPRSNGQSAFCRKAGSARAFVSPAS